MNTKQQPRHSEPLISIAEVADRLGVANKTVRRMIASGELPAVQVGSRRIVRVDPRDVHALLVRVR